MKKYLPTKYVNIGIASVLLLWLVNMWSTHYFNWSPDKLSDYIVKNDLKASKCNKLVTWSVPGPLPDDQIRTCIYLVASKTKDPSTCELLMPSSYGLSCVGGATSVSKTCNFYNGDRNVYWLEEDNQHGKTSFSSCKRDDQSSSTLRNMCCLMIRVAFVKTENSCSDLVAHQDLFDECQNNLAIKNRDPHACAMIQNSNLKTACNIRTLVMKEHPALCEECARPVENIDHLE